MQIFVISINPTSDYRFLRALIGKKSKYSSLLYGWLSSRAVIGQFQVRK